MHSGDDNDFSSRHRVRIVRFAEPVALWEAGQSGQSLPVSVHVFLPHLTLNTLGVNYQKLLYIHDVQDT